MSVTANDVLAARVGGQATERASSVYGVENWGAGYFSIACIGFGAVTTVQPWQQAYF